MTFLIISFIYHIQCTTNNMRWCNCTLGSYSLQYGINKSERAPAHHIYPCANFGEDIMNVFKFLQSKSNLVSWKHKNIIFRIPKQSKASVHHNTNTCAKCGEEIANVFNIPLRKNNNNLPLISVKVNYFFCHGNVKK